MEPVAAAPVVRFRFPKLLRRPLVAVGLLLALGLLGWAADLPLVFASLGPTIAGLALRPHDAENRFSRILFGHLIGMLAGIAAVWVCGLQERPAADLDAPLAGAWFASAAIALALTLIYQPVFRVVHLAGAATALVFALGMLPASARAACLVASAAIVVALGGELLRALRPAPRPT